VAKCIVERLIFLIVFQSINLVSCIPAIILCFFRETYYLRASPDLKEKKLFKNVSNFFHLEPLPMEKKKHLKGFRFYAFGDEDVVLTQAEKMLPESLLCNANNFFPNVNNLTSKLRIALLDKFNYLDVGMVALFINSGERFRVVWFVHSSFLSYIKRESGVKGANNFHHVLFPSDDLCRLIQFTQSFFYRMFSFLQKIKYRESLKEAPHKFSPTQETAVFFHQSISYGKLFKKLHYFSTELNSRLHPTRVSCFVLDRMEISDGQSIGGDLILIDFVRSNKLSDLFATMFFVLTRGKYARSFYELSGTLILAQVFFGYLGWRRSLLKYKNLKNAIIDYDILYPKSLALAFESCGVRTIAMQERGSSSFAASWGTIVDTFLFAGGLFTQYAERNKTNFFRKSINFGQWRTSLFYSNTLHDYKELSYIKFGKNHITDFNSVICCLGLFTDLENPSSSVILSPKSSLDFYTKVKRLAHIFTDSALIIRLKIMSEFDRNIIHNFFEGSNNVFLCNEYSKMNASYSLCQRADVVVSLFTSLAEECFAVGKKTILIDDTHNFIEICKDIYPEDFYFAIAQGSDELVSLVSKCLDNDPALLLKYELLKKKLSGTFDMHSVNIIPDTLEKYLQ
jgi:hypothetical protein